MQKNGQAGKATFPTRQLAESYARSVKAPRLEDLDLQIPDVQVQACPVATTGMQSQATGVYYRSVKEPKRGMVVETREDPETRHERMAEHFAEARVLGISQEAAWSDWDASHD